MPKRQAKPKAMPKYVRVEDFLKRIPPEYHEKFLNALKEEIRRDMEAVGRDRSVIACDVHPNVLGALVDAQKACTFQAYRDN